MRYEQTMSTPTAADSTSGESGSGTRPRLQGFGRFRFDPDTGELWRDGHAVRLAPKPAKVLGVLLDADGELVTRREIELRVWGDLPIDLNRSVNFAVRQIRSALGDTADAPTYIETLPKRGYRFIAPIRHTALEPSAPPASRPPQASSFFRRPRFIAGLCLGLVLWVGIAVRGNGLTAPEATARPMLAVLPMEQLGDPGPDAHLATGLTDELITILARLDPERLGVIARTSSGRAAQSGQSDAEIATTLRAAYLVGGTVRPGADGVRINVRLVDATDGEVLWADRYVETVPVSAEVEMEIAAHVADALRTQLIPDLAVPVPEGARTVAAAVRDAYRRGQYLLQQGSDQMDDAETLLRQALAMDSTYAPARAALGQMLLRRRRNEEGRRELREAMRQDPTLAAPHIAMGIDALYTRWDMTEAGRHFERARALEPGNVLSHHPYSYFLSIAGRHDEAIAEMETALELDPVSPLVNGDVGRIYYRAGRFKEAKERCERTVQLVPEDAAALSCLVNIHMLEDNPQGALRWARVLMGEHQPPPAADSSAVDAAAAMTDYFQWRLTAMRRAAENGRFTYVAMAQAALFLGRREAALDALETALDLRSPVLPQVPGDPCFAILEGDPRYEALVEAMGIGARA